MGHQVDHPLVGIRMEHRIPILDPSADQVDDDLPRLPLDRQIAPLVPDRFDDGAGFTRNGSWIDVINVIQIVIIDPNRETIPRRVSRHALGHGPRDEHTFTFEAQIEVVCSGVVLMDDEPQPLVICTTSHRSRLTPTPRSARCRFR